MDAFNDSPRPNENEISLSRFPARIEIPLEVWEQEADIEWILRNLIPLDDGTCLKDAHSLPETTRKQGAVWILTGVLGFVSIIAFCLLWIRQL